MNTKPKVGINGLGRIGRAIYRINRDSKLFDIAVINDINQDKENIVYTLNYDTTYGRLKPKVRVQGNEIIDVESSSLITNKKDISDVNWNEYGVDFVIDSSGQYLEQKIINKLKNQIKNLIVTNAPEYVEHSIILGANDKSLDPKNNFVISSSICDAIAGAPILNLINDEYGIINGTLITLHPWLGYQRLLDGSSIPYWQLHPDPNKKPENSKHHYALGRSAPMNIIPKSTSAVSAIEKVINALKGKIDSHSYRIPTQIVSAATFTVNTEKTTNKKNIIDLFDAYITRQNFNIINCTDEPLTANDFIGETYSAVIDHRWTSVGNSKTIKLHYWYDNEWGYSSRVYDLAYEILEFY